MAFPLLPATLLLIAGGLAALDYLIPPEEDTPAPPTSGIQEPYEPPFEGGQCNVFYRIIISFTANGTQRYLNITNPNFIGATTNPSNPLLQNSNNVFLGAIESISLSGTGTLGNRPYWTVVHANGTTSGSYLFDGAEPVVSGLSVFSISRIDGNPDNCGNLPNPNPEIPISSSGLAQSSDPDLIEDTTPLSEGLVPLNLAALLAAAKAALAAAATLAELANAIAEVLDLIAKLLDKLKPENRDKYKSTFLYQFGSVSGDGFLRLYGNVSNNDFEAIWVDFLFTDIPSGYGKYLGSLSPNRFIYDRLGHIAFVSPSLGVCEVHDIQFPRQSFAVPKDAIGFFYHLGLNGSTKANVSAIYEKENLPVE